MSSSDAFNLCISSKGAVELVAAFFLLSIASAEAITESFDDLANGDSTRRDVSFPSATVFGEEEGDLAISERLAIDEAVEPLLD